jgi:hypothetical protein
MNWESFMQIQLPVFDIVKFLAGQEVHVGAQRPCPAVIVDPREVELKMVGVASMTVRLLRPER